jgi:hypothetical protein
LIWITLRSLNEARRRIDDPQGKSLADGVYFCLIGYMFTSFFVTCEFELLYLLLAVALVVISLAKVPVRYTKADAKNVLKIQAAGMFLFFMITKLFYRLL